MVVSLSVVGTAVASLRRRSADSASLRALFRTGQFADVRAELTDVPGGVRVDFVVRQNLYINRVQIVGLREPPGESRAISALPS